MRKNTWHHYHLCFGLVARCTYRYLSAEIHSTSSLDVRYTLDHCGFPFFFCPGQFNISQQCFLPLACRQFNVNVKKIGKCGFDQFLTSRPTVITEMGIYKHKSMIRHLTSSKNTEGRW